MRIPVDVRGPAHLIAHAVQGLLHYTGGRRSHASPQRGTHFRGTRLCDAQCARDAAVACYRTLQSVTFYGYGNGDPRRLRCNTAQLYARGSQVRRSPPVAPHPGMPQYANERTVLELVEEGQTAIISAAWVPTAQGARYVNRLTKHWSHRFVVSRGEGRGSIDFGDGHTCTLESTRAAVRVRVEVADQTALRSCRP